MNMLDANLKAQLGTYLERVTLPVELRPSLDDGESSRELRALLEAIASLSDKITLVDGAPRGAHTPSFEIALAGTDIGVRFAGIPLGHDLTSLVLVLLQVGGHLHKLYDVGISQIRSRPG